LHKLAASVLLSLAKITAGSIYEREVSTRENNVAYTID
jgi:hypothetical protein